MSFGQGIECRNWCWMLNINYCYLSFLTTDEFYNLGHIQGIYYKGALTQKRSFVVLWTTFRSDFHVGWKNQNKHSTLNLSFEALSKWHDPHIDSNCFWFRIRFGALICTMIRMTSNMGRPFWIIFRTFCRYIFSLNIYTFVSKS